MDGRERAPFLLRIDVPLDRTLAFAWAGRNVLPEAAVLVDFGGGRISMATPTLSVDAWQRLGATAREMEGHAVLEKADGEFARRDDLFGSPRAEWSLTHRIKSVLDPHHVFAPVLLPGKK